MSNNVGMGRLHNAEKSSFMLREIVNENNSELKMLSLCQIDMKKGVSPRLSFAGEELMVYNLKGKVKCEVNNTIYQLEHYDTIYIPIDTPVRFINESDDDVLIYIYRAKGDKKYEVFHSKWNEFRTNEKRIRLLKRKKVYIMFDVSENANKFIAGYTFYETYSRAWPPHNHTDQEEIYSFIEGYGAMSVYPDDENQTFVTSVKVGDSISIPILNYHPVFSHESELCFIWCIAGERYWVGDKNKDFMTGKVNKITT